MERENTRRKIEELIMEGTRKKSRSSNSSTSTSTSTNTNTNTNTNTAIIQTKRWIPINTKIEGIRKYLRD
jgi:hypothetical protein